MVFKRKQYTTVRQKRVAFLTGFILWFVVNGAIWSLNASLFRSGFSLDDYEAAFWNLCLLPLNLIILIYLGFARGWVALGVLSAVALNLAVALILGISIYGTCAVPFFIDFLYG